MFLTDHEYTSSLKSANNGDVSVSVAYEYTITFLILFSLLMASLASSIAALAFLVFGLYHFVTRLHFSISAVRFCWPLLLFSIIGILSALWSDFPIVSFKRGIQLLLTTLICCSLLYSIRREVIISMLSLSFGLVIIYGLSSPTTVNIFYTGEVIRVGYFGSKNNMSLFASFALVIGLATVALPKTHVWLKAVGALTSLLALFVFFQAKSLGSVLALGVCLCISFLFYVYSQKQYSWINKPVFNYLAIFYLVLLVSFGIYVFNYDAFSELMYSLGKDPTITGRTLIWQIGSLSIAENPFLGIGLDAYWNASNEGALEIWEWAKKDVGSSFSFHNLYVNYYVELGILGVTSILFIYLTNLYQLTKMTMKKMSIFDFFLVSILLFFIAKSFIESIGFQPFDKDHFMLCLTWVYLHKATYSERRTVTKFKV